MITFDLLKNKNHETAFSDEAIVDFLFTHLEEYGDPKDQIQACMDYVWNKGGFICIASDDSGIQGAVVVNETGMSGYIPENILVYIAVDGSQRGKGVGKHLMEMVIEHARGAVALHVEPHNPAKRLYERMGFENKYLEMRLNR